MRAKNLVKVATIGEVMSRRRSIILRELSFKFHHENIVTKARCFNYTNILFIYYTIYLEAILNMDDLKQKGLTRDQF